LSSRVKKNVSSCPSTRYSCVDITESTDFIGVGEMSFKRLKNCASLVALLAGGGAAFAADTGAAGKPVEVAAAGDTNGIESILVTARRRAEDSQNVPISLSVLSADTLNKTSTYNVSQLAQLVPSLNYSSPNPRNTAYTIRGLGSSVVAIAQANDGLEPGVGFYVDQVYQARPATAAFDFVDIDHVEILRGPQGTLFGKNTTAGAISITTKSPTFEPEAYGELSGGTLGYFQGKGTVSGPLIDNVLAGRFSATMTTRDGVLKNVTTGGTDNNIDSYGLRGQMLYRLYEDFHVRLSADFSAIASNCCTQVFVRVGTSLKPAASQYPALAAGAGYAPPSTNPYARLTDIDAPIKVATSQGGLSGIADWNMGDMTLTSVTAWRFWDWDAANDRDYTSLSIQTLQHIPSTQVQYSQELRVASNGTNTIDYVAGLYWFEQSVRGRPITQYGSQAAYWLLGPPPANPSNLLTGYQAVGQTYFMSDSYAAFGEGTWHATDALSLNAGIRYTQEHKSGRYSAAVSGGLATADPTLINKQLSILRPQSYTAFVSEGNPSGRISADYHVTDGVMAYVSYAKGYKSGGINMSGLPLNAANLPALSTAVIKPEKDTTTEIGVKTKFLDDHLLLNVDYFYTNVRNFQTNIVDTGPGALRGYLANIPLVRVKGFEGDGSFIIDENLSGHVSASWTDGKYVSYASGPCPLDRIAASTTVCNLSGKSLSNLPKWALSVGGDYTHPLSLAGLDGDGTLHVEATTRSSVYGDPSDSQYTLISGYSVFNASIGFRSGPWEAFVWAKNLLDQNYMQNLTVQAGNSGLIVGTPDDPRAIGVTLRARY
jgi:iron complex outermembrane receptor protein